MTRPWTNALADYTASFPSVVYTPKDFRNYNEDGIAVTGEAITIPASSPYKLILDYVPLEQTGIVVTIDSTAYDVIPFGETPLTGQIAISFITGEVEFASADASLTGDIDYTGAGTALTADLLNQIGKELAAAQTAVDGIDLSAKVTGPASSVDNTVARYDSTTGKLIQTSGVVIDDSDNITTTGDIEAADGLFTGSGGVTATGGRIIARQASGGSGFEAYSYGSNSIFNCFRAQGSEGSETTIGSGRTIGRFQFVGHDGTDYMSGARLVGITTEIWTGSARGTKFQLEATSTGTTTLETKMETTDLGIEVLSQITFTTAITTASASNNSVFINSADGKLTFKNSSGTSTALY